MPGKKFRFSMESVLKLRRYEGDQARQALGTAMSNRQKQEEEVRKQEEALRDVAYGAPAGGTVAPWTLKKYAAFQRDAHHRYDDACRALVFLQQREDQARALMRVRHGAEESIQTLRGKERAAHRKAELDAEGAFLDEQAVSGFHRKRRRAKVA